MHATDDDPGEELIIEVSQSLKSTILRKELIVDQRVWSQVISASNIPKSCPRPFVRLRLLSSYGLIKGRKKIKTLPFSDVGKGKTATWHAYRNTMARANPEDILVCDLYNANTKGKHEKRRVVAFRLTLFNILSKKSGERLALL